MTKSNANKKLIVIDSIGSLPELGGISGPVINPFYVDNVTLNRLLANRRKVFEVNPANKSEKVRLTLKNMKTKNFPDANVKEVAHVAPADKVVKKESPKTGELANDTDMVVSKTSANPEKPASDFTKK